MASTLSYSHAREHLAEVLDKVESDQEEVIITRRGHEPIALIPAAELASLKETAHLLRSPKNAARLIMALRRAQSGKGTRTDVESLARELGLPGRSE